MQVQLMNTSTNARVPPIHATPKSVAALARTAPTMATPIFDHILGSPTSTAAERRRPPGLIAIARSTVATHGVRGLWLGHTGTILRETGGMRSLSHRRFISSNSYQVLLLGSPSKSGLRPSSSTVGLVQPEPLNQITCYPGNRPSLARFPVLHVFWRCIPPIP
jgi:ornithine carrier protein